MFSKFCRC